MLSVGKYKAIGLMSGSSLDGLDIAYAEFEWDGNRWQYRLGPAETVVYDDYWKKKLSGIRAESGVELIRLHHFYGRFLGEAVLKFMKKHGLAPQVIASHGHTVFHNAEEGYSFQLGYGQAIARITGVTTVTDFRNVDMLHGGNGAPLVPVGDELLFGEYAACINIGGIANISFRYKGKRVAFDCCPANQLIDFLAAKKGLPYDKDGLLALSGNLHGDLWHALMQDPWLALPYPKSLSNEQVADYYFPLMDKMDLPLEDRIKTVTAWVAERLARALSDAPEGKVLLTGGGVKNKLLVRLLRETTKHEIVIPRTSIIDYKEALIFALIGVLRLEGKVNCLSSATGAAHDSSTGVIYQP